MKLNPQQQEAIEYLGGPLLVLAGAGSGKTRVITQKIAYMIRKKHFQAHKIAAITFTNKAAKEMQERIALQLDKSESKGLTVCTFHSLGMRMLREDAAAVGYKKQFSILDSSDSQKIIQEIIGSSGKDAIFKTQGQLSLWKNDLISPEQALLMAENEWERQMAQVYASYQATLQAYQAVDFDDLIKLPAEILKNNAEIRYKWQERFQYLLIDECQDTNACQYTLMRQLTGLEGRFTAVGDDDQSIYAWRGANVENLKLLQQDYPHLKVIKLEQNYRSTARILKVANQVISHNPTKLFEKKLWSEFGMGDEIQVITCQHERHEAEVVASKILQSKLQRGDSAKYNDYAILYRGNHQAKLFEEALRSQRIPYQISGGQSFFDRAEIKDILAYVRLLINEHDEPAFLRAITTPKRGIGEVTLAKLNEFAQVHQLSLFEAASHPEAIKLLPSKNQADVNQFILLLADLSHKAQTLTAGEFMGHLLEMIQYENHLYATEEGKRGEMKWKNIQDLVRWLNNKGEQDNKNIIELGQTIALMNLLEGKDEDEIDSVKMLTLHASKGLEYPHVFLVGCEEGLFPHAECQEDDKIEEERRLMYVGITRAQKSLMLTHCVKRKKAGQWQFSDPSRFINEMPQGDLRFFGRKNSEPIVSKNEGKQKLSNMRSMLDAIKNKKE